MDTVGRLRYLEHRSIPEIHRELTRRGIVVAEAAPSPTSWVATMSCGLLATLADPGRLGPRCCAQGRVILAIDGLQPDVGHECPLVCCAIASPARSSWPRASGRRPPGEPGRPDSDPRCGRPCRCRSPAPVSDGQGRASARPAALRPQRCPASTLPFPLPPRGGRADLRGGSPRQEGVEGAGCGAFARSSAAGGGEDGVGGEEDAEAEVVCGATAWPPCAARTDDDLPPPGGLRG